LDFISATGWILFYILIACLIAAVAVGGSYLYFNVLSNAISLLFVDTKCDNWVWQTCHSSIFIQYENSNDYTLYSPSLATFIGFLMHISVIAPAYLAVYSIFDGSCLITSYWLCCTDDLERFRHRHIGSYKRSYIAPWVWGSISWVFLWVSLSLFLGRKLAISSYDGCSIYQDYGIQIQHLQSFSSVNNLKIRSYGVGQGGYMDLSLPGTSEGYSDCLNKGYWTVFLVATIAVPLVILCVWLLVVRYQSIKREIVADIFSQSSNTIATNTSKSSNNDLEAQFGSTSSTISTDA